VEASPQRKKSPSKKSKKADSSSSEDESGSGSGSSEEEEPELSAGIQAKIKSIVASGIESLTIRQIKEQLKTDFADEVENKGPEIKAFVHKCVESQ